MVQDVVDLVSFCGESFCFTSFGCILKMCEHVLPISLFKMCFICLQCLDVFKTIRLIAMGIGWPNLVPLGEMVIIGRNGIQSSKSRVQI